MSEFIGAGASSRRIVWITAGAILLLIGWLAWRSDQGLIAEQEARHAAVAARVFDELERELTTIVQQEESHPFLDWQSAGREGHWAGASPLAKLSENDPRLAYLQWEPSGELTSPSWAGTEDRDQGAVESSTKTLGAASRTPAVDRSYERLQQLARSIGPAPQDPAVTAVASAGTDAAASSALGNAAAATIEATPQKKKPSSKLRRPAANPQSNAKLSNASDASQSSGDGSNGADGQHADEEDSAGQQDGSGWTANADEPQQQQQQQQQMPQQQMPPPQQMQQMQSPQQAANSLENFLSLGNDEAPGDVLAQNSLNRGATPRQQRTVANVQTSAEELENFVKSNKAVSKSLSKVGGASLSHKTPAGDGLGTASEMPLDGMPREPVPPIDQRPIDVEISPMQALLWSGNGDSDADAAATTHDGAAQRSTEANSSQGAARNDPAMLLWRTVTIEGQRWRQMVAFDLATLERRMEAQVLGGLDEELRRGLQLEWHVRTTGAATPFAPGMSYRSEGAYLFHHEFAEPFGFLALTLSMQPLADTGGSARVRMWALSGIVALCVLLMAVLLQRTMKRALAAAQERSDFVSAVTHELRTPLTSIRMYSEMLEQGMVPTDEKREEYARTIRLQSERLSRLVDSVLTFARIERGVASPTAKAPLGRIVDEALRTCEPQRSEKGLRIRTDLVGVESIPLPHDALVQVLINLLDNAIKFSAAVERSDVHVPDSDTSGDAPGKAANAAAGARASSGRDASAIEIIARRTQDGVELSVLDRGAGVPSEQLDQIFRPFVRGERELTRETTGTGIGLALVAGLVREAGGSVRARRRKRGGLEVSVRWPVA